MSESDAHIQDSAILAMSKQEGNDKGMIRFLATLPSGREVATGWFDPGVKRDKIQAWLQAVRAEIVADEEEQRMRSKRGAMPSLESPPDVPSAAQLQQTHGRTMQSASTTGTTPAAQTSQQASPALSPEQFVRQAVSRAEQEVVYWREEAVKASENWESARLSLQKWKAIEASLGVKTSEESPPSDSAGPESGADSVSEASSES